MSSLTEDREELDENRSYSTFKKDACNKMPADKRGVAGHILEMQAQIVDTKEQEKEREISQRTNINLLHSENIIVPDCEEVRILFGITIYALLANYYCQLQKKLCGTDLPPKTSESTSLQEDQSPKYKEQDTKISLLPSPKCVAPGSQEVDEAKNINCLY